MRRRSSPLQNHIGRRTEAAHLDSDLGWGCRLEQIELLRARRRDDEQQADYGAREEAVNASLGQGR